MRRLTPPVWRRLGACVIAATTLTPALLPLAPAQAATSANPATDGAAVADPAALVDPMVGTGSGNSVVGQVDTFPGADVPFGMLQWSPDTPSRADGGGYNYADSDITGFSLTHFSGPGSSARSPAAPFAASRTLIPCTSPPGSAVRSPRRAPGAAPPRRRSPVLLAAPR